MDVGGIFRNIFRLPSSKKDESTSTVNTTASPTGLDNNAGIYDDTDLASRSQSQGMNRRRNPNPEIRKLPSFCDIGRDDDDDEDKRGQGRVDLPPPRRDREMEIRGFPGSAFVFGDLFSMAREMFVEMERSMKDMDEFFSNEAFFPNPGPGIDIPSVLDGADLITEGEHEQRQRQNQNPDNIRDQVLKPDPRKLNERVDPDLDDLYKNSLSVVPRIPGGMLEDAWKGKEGQAPNPTNRFQYSRTFRQYQSSPEGTIIQGKTVRETNEGREVTTYKRNDKGEVEESTEFIPRGQNEPLPTITDGNSNSPTATEEFPSFSGGFRFRDFFFPPRPRM